MAKIGWGNGRLDLGLSKELPIQKTGRGSKELMTQLKYLAKASGK